MISVIIPTLNEEARLPVCLSALVGASIDGVVKEVIVVDGGSTDKTIKIADEFGAEIVSSAPGRGGQLRLGGDKARGEWLLFLHGDTVLEEGWVEDAEDLMANHLFDVGVFRMAFDSKSLAARIVSAGANIRTKWLKRPYGDQGLLISREFYNDIGGYQDIPLMEDVDIIRRIVGRCSSDSIRLLDAKATTSADRYERDGYARRVIKNFILINRYRLGASPEKLAKAYR